MRLPSGGLEEEDKGNDEGGGFAIAAFGLERDDELGQEVGYGLDALAGGEWQWLRELRGFNAHGCGRKQQVDAGPMEGAVCALAAFDSVAKCIEGLAAHAQGVDE